MAERRFNPLLGTHLNAWQQLTIPLKSELFGPIRAMTQQLAAHASLPARQAVAEFLTPQRLQMQQAIKGLMSPSFAQLRASFAELPPRARAAVLTLAEHGWYFDIDLPFPALWDLEAALLAGDVDEAEIVLCEYFESRLQVIEARAVDRFPARERFITEALRAHAEGRYALSIPLLFAQVDGICKDVTDHYLFIGSRKLQGKPGTAEYIRDLTGYSLFTAVLTPLAEPIPVTATSGRRPPGFAELNRHMVLHGESLDYDTRTNGLKTVSLLGYVSDVLANEPRSS